MTNDTTYDDPDDYGPVTRADLDRATFRVGDTNGRSLYNSRMQAPAVHLPDYLPDAIRRIARELDPLQIILSGSWARGDARPDSDLDLLIVMPRVDNKRETAIRALRALRDLPAGKDVVVTTPQEIEERGDEIGLVLRPALREGIVVYAND